MLDVQKGKFQGCARRRSCAALAQARMSGGKQVLWACSCLFPEQLWPSCRKMERTVKEGASEDGSSAIRQAYLAALQQELASLYQLMAQLDALAGHPLPIGGIPLPVEEPSNSVRRFCLSSDLHSCRRQKMQHEHVSLLRAGIDCD